MRRRRPANRPCGVVSRPGRQGSAARRPSEHQDRPIREPVESGRYRDANEVVSDALGLAERRERAEQARIQALRQAVAVGLEDIGRGAVVEADANLLGDIEAELDGR